MEYLCVKCRRLAETEQCPWCGSRETKEAEGSDYCYLSEWGGEEAGALADLLNLNSIPFQTRKSPCDTKRTYYSFFVPYRALEDAKDTILTQLSGSRAAAEGARDDSGPFDGDEVDRMEMVELDGMSLEELRAYKDRLNRTLKWVRVQEKEWKRRTTVLMDMREEAENLIDEMS